MGADGYADENGEVEILVESYERDGLAKAKTVKIIHIGGLKPRERITVDWLKGEPR